MAPDTVAPFLVRTLRATLWCVLVAGGVGCITAVPGAESVRTTRNPADVTGCTAVGNVSVSKDVHKEFFNPHQQALNEVAGLGGNVLLETTSATTSALTEVETGAAYRCASPTATTTPAAH